MEETGKGISFRYVCLTLDDSICIDYKYNELDKVLNDYDDVVNYYNDI